MADEVDFGWLSLLQRRADFIRRSAAGARSPGIAKEFEELAALYDGVAGRAEAEAARQAGDKAAWRSDPKSTLIKHLLSRSHDFLSQARNTKDKARAEELKYLSGAYGAEASRIKNDGIR